MEKSADAEIIGYVRTLYAYVDQTGDSDVLTFKANETIALLSKDSSGWWLGILNKRFVS